MRDDTIEQIRRLAGDDLDAPVEGPFVLGVDDLPKRSRGVYVIENTAGLCMYVGKICSVADMERLGTRIGEHRRSSPAKMIQFDKVYFVPLKAEVNEGRVRQLKGRSRDTHDRPLGEGGHGIGPPKPPPLTRLPDP